MRYLRHGVWRPRGTYMVRWKRLSRRSYFSLTIGGHGNVKRTRTLYNTAVPRFINPRFPYPTTNTGKVLFYTAGSDLTIASPSTPTYRATWNSIITDTDLQQGQPNIIADWPSWD